MVFDNYYSLIYIIIKEFIKYEVIKMKFMMDIREKTSLLHSAAENTGYIKKLVDGTASVDGYAEYIYNLEKMYKAIESALDKYENNAVVKPFVTKELYRSELIRKDLNFLLGDKLNSMKLLASTAPYGTTSARLRRSPTTCNYLQIRSFGGKFSPGTFSAQDLSTSELLRTL